MGALSGTVSSTVLGPLEGVTVTNGIQSAVTGADGVYLIPEIPVGGHSFSVTDVPISAP